ncbi:hypothetical protein [Pontibacter oryzae]|uniref:Uncharacterized protein n=1 Tax=Pontibacter oryzae TaxID=2304593 RepID=A0A399RT35_9BACT|nr:hypothetical protein [Pontibacter oryzae]RIJ34021.1 hypothetical protein D1627_16750 [Pontibacter oryzae]
MSTLLFQEFSSPTDSSMENIHNTLELIQQKLLQEIEAKQFTIKTLENKLGRLESIIDGNQQLISTLYAELNQNQRSTEGNRQLVNKLLNDIDRLQQDIEWYKRTYENRSMIGILREKIFGRK